MRKCYKCDKVGHQVKDCRFKQKMKIRKSQEENESDEEDDEKKGFVKGLE